MSLLDPLFLAGLLGVAIPIIIHYLNRRQVTRIRIPTFEFLMEAREESVWWHSIREWIVLALRILVVVLLVSIFTRPLLTGCQGAESTASRLPKSTVFVVDTSASMRAKGGQSRLRAFLTKKVNQFSPWDEGAIVSSLDTDNIRLTQNTEKLRDTIGSVALTHTEGPSIARLVSRANSILKKGSNPVKRIVVVSDMTKSAISELATKKLDFPISFDSIHPSDSLSNVGIRDVQFSRNGRQIAARVELARYRGEGPTEVDLTFVIDGKTVAESTTEIAKQVKTETFSHLLEADRKEIYRGFVELNGDDDYEPDNRFYFAFKGGKALNLLVINGEPSGVSYNDEVFFLTRAFESARGSDTDIEYDVGTVSVLNETNLSDYDVVWLANEDHLDTKQARQLGRFAENGNGIVISAGDQIEPRRFNNVFKGLTTLRFRDRRIWSGQFGERSIGIRALNKTDPFFSGFEAPFESIRIKTHILFKRRNSTGAKTLLEVENGAPLLRSGAKKGRFVAWATSIDDEWSNFPLTRTFVPLVQRICMFAGGRLQKRLVRETTGNRLSSTRLERDSARVQIASPSSAEPKLNWEPKSEVVKPHRFKLDRPGFFRFESTSKNGSSPLVAVVNTTRKESDFRRVDLDQIRAKLTDSRRQNRDRASRDSVAMKHRGDPIWPTLMLAFAFLLVAESMIREII